jgi:Skp family chaperone for outer membrane proteins
MKMNLKSFLFAGLLLAISAPATFAQGKIGVVDLRLIFEGYYKTKQADVKIKERAAELDAQRATMVSGFTAAEASYKKAEELAKDLSVSPDEADRRKTEAANLMRGLGEKQKEIQAWERQATASIQEQQTRIRARVLEEIQSEVTAIAKAGSYFMILDKDAASVNQTKVLVYFNGENDITKQVLADLNSGAPAGLVEPPAK